MKAPGTSLGPDPPQPHCASPEPARHPIHVHPRPAETPDGSSRPPGSRRGDMDLTVAAAARAARSPGPDAHLPLLRNLHRHLAAARPREERKWLAGGSGYKGRGATTRRCATATLASAHGK